MAAHPTPKTPPLRFSGYQKLVVGLLAFLQFTVVLDFMILSPLGPIVMPRLGIDAARFGLVVSAYAFSAGISGILAAGFADRFDRKRILLLFYAGFLFGTFLCGIAPSFHFLLVARVVTGLFGGVIASISYAIVADLFPPEARGRAMGSIQSAFAASQVMGIPAGLFLANHFGWNGPFLVIAAVGALVGVVMVLRMRPVRDHLATASQRHPVTHLWRTATNPRYMVGFLASMLTATGGFMLQPFASNFGVHNLGIPLEHLPVLYMAAGLTGMVAGPLAGRLADRHGQFTVLAVATPLSALLVIWWCQLGITPLWLVVIGNCALFATINARIVSTMALISSVPDPRDRGAYMSASSSMQQFAGAVSSAVAGLVVVQEPSGRIANYPLLGWIVVGAFAVTLLQMWNVSRMVAAGASRRD